ncbi:MAG: TasA family protein [Patescibacteria group bacterium]|jgi:predicted ribosomally synthesized peptide with SipW-like signal peptide
MKKIIISLAMIAAVGALAIGATTAFFSDTETSTGNTFTAGAIDLKVDSQCTYNGVSSNECGTWGQNDGKDIVGEKFFSFIDLKPGDQGENTISLHIDNNPAYVCAKIAITSDLDKTCTEPELLNDTGCAVDTAGYGGEIAENLSLAWWADDGDNILEDAEESFLFYLSEMPLSSMLAYGTDNTLYLTLADSSQNFFTNVAGPMNGSQTYHFGLRWCFGSMAIDKSGTGNPAITCNGANVDNGSQTDSLTGDLAFSAIQARNNGTFVCADTFKQHGTSW